MIVVVLVVIWVIALTPFLLRRLTEHQISSSVAKFRSATGMLRRIYPRSEEAAFEVGPSGMQPVVTARTAAMRRKKEVERARRRLERKKQLLFRLVGGTGAAIVIGAVPHLHFVWDFAIVGAILTTAYVSALAYLAQRPQSLPTLQRATSPVRRPAPERSQERLVASGGGGPFVVAPIQRRPAFVLVDPNA